MGVGTLPSRNVLSKQTGSIMRALRISAFTLTLIFILALLPNAGHAQNSGAAASNSGAYKVAAYKKKRKYKRRYRKRRSYRSKRRSRPKPVVAAWPDDKTLNGPVQIVISLPDQRMTLFKAGKKIASSRVSTGKAGHRTPSGIFSIIQKNRRHFSNLYAGAPMPNMQRITWSGIAMHAGALPGYPASHGCIRLPYGFSKKLFGYTDMGEHVVVSRGMIAPKPISHAALFQPVPAASDVGPRVALEKQASAVNAPASESTPRIVADRAQESGMVTNTAASDTELSLVGTAQAASQQVLKKLAALDAGTASDAVDGTSTQSVLRRHLIQKMRARQWPRDAQRLLKDLGIYKGRVDGDAGRATTWAVKKFQGRLGMNVTGKIDKELILALNRISGKEIDLSFRNVKLPKGEAPLRILITRKKVQENATIVQKLLNQLGYDTGGIDGYLGKMSVAAIRDFQTEKGLPVTGTVSKELIGELYKANGKRKPGEWHLYVRQEFLDMFDAPIDVRDSATPLGTHLFTSMHFEKDATKTDWTALTMSASSGKAKRKCKWNRKKRRRICTTIPAPVVTNITASEALERLEIPKDVNEIISELLTPGSSMIVTDNGISYETGKGTDFIVLTR